ncbi:MAG: hypothetical protein ABR510_13260 [Trueperaceae bacterium]
MRLIGYSLAAALVATPLGADEPRIRDATASKSGMSWRVDVTLEHPDSGWDHYADGWEVLDADGNRLGYRMLHHPHVDEQPFTRSLTSLDLPDGTRQIHVRAHCSVDGWGEETFRIDLEP